MIADTVKGRGATVFEPIELPHSGSALYAFRRPGPDQYAAAMARSPAAWATRTPERGAGAAPVRPAAPGSWLPTARRWPSGRARAAPRGLDADLYLDCGLIPFRQRFPERFVECGIAEQDMVSQAGALALGGMLPAVHSFAAS